jgi:sialate O-acetylesterase
MEKYLQGGSIPTLKTLGILVLMFFISAQWNSFSQSFWPEGYKAAVCLTYDDGLDNHLNIVMPQLDSLGLKGTFFVQGNSGCLFRRMDEWRKLAASGHEIGNHSLFHPCDWKGMGLGIYGDYDLTKYSYKKFINELRTANTLLKAVDGKETRTYAYTCSNYMVEGCDISDSLKYLFTSARCDGPLPETMEGYNIYKTHSWCVGEPNTAEELIAYVDRARSMGTIAVFMFHNIGGNPGSSYFNLDAAKHRALLKYLHDHKTEYYVATFREVMEYIRVKQLTTD